MILRRPCVDMCFVIGDCGICACVFLIRATDCIVGASWMQSLKRRAVLFA